MSHFAGLCQECAELRLGPRVASENLITVKPPNRPTSYGILLYSPADSRLDPEVISVVTARGNDSSANRKMHGFER